MAYVYEGVVDIVPDDMGGVGTNPLTTANFVANADGTTYSYTIDYLGPGEYTAAYTCEGDMDEPESDDSLMFLVTTTFTVASTGTQ